MYGHFGEESGVGYVYFTSTTFPGKVVGFHGRWWEWDHSSSAQATKGVESVFQEGESSVTKKWLKEIEIENKGRDGG